MASAQFPNVEDTIYFAAVCKHMIHGPCGILNMKHYCMKHEVCRFDYPKRLSSNTTIPGGGGRGAGAVGGDARGGLAAHGGADGASAGGGGGVPQIIPKQARSLEDIIPDNPYLDASDVWPPQTIVADAFLNRRVA